MGLFSLGKNNKLIEWQNALLEEPVNKLIMDEQRLKKETEIKLQNDIRVINDSTQIISKTIKPDVFFERLFTIEIKTNDIVKLEKFAKFQGALPSDALNEFYTEKQECIHQFLVRYFCNVFDKAEKLKTDKSKLNAYQKFYDSLQEYYGVMDENNIDYIETKYKAYTRLYNKK